mmetsp:Transcript_88593/g.173290  ORF Transcript_88593/g.173290 Transcript_88593/m.173290 type:complete len:329 (+) Transcript_88593:742-1728(+)
MRIALNAVNDALLHGDSLFRVRSSSRFCAKHDAIRTIINCGCHITGFSTGGCWVLNHGFQHLCSNNHWPSLLAAFVDNGLLENRHIFGWAFDTQISTGNHDTVAKVDQSLQIVSVKAGRLFNFGHDTRFEVTLGDFGINDGSDLFNIFGTLHKGQSDPIDTNFQHVIKIASILGSKRTDFQNGIRSVDSLAITNLSWYLDDTIKVTFSLSSNSETNFAIVHQKSMSHFTGLDNFGVGKLDTSVVTHGRIQIQSEALSLLKKFTSWTGKFTNTKFRSLQITKDANWMSILFFNFANRHEKLFLLLFRAMREVETEEISSCQEQLLNHFT